MFNEKSFANNKNTSQELSPPPLHLFSLWEEVYSFCTECLLSPGLFQQTVFSAIAMTYKKFNIRLEL